MHRFPKIQLEVQGIFVYAQLLIKEAVDKDTKRRLSINREQSRL
jgi:hypothetical protein